MRDSCELSFYTGSSLPGSVSMMENVNEFSSSLSFASSSYLSNGSNSQNLYEHGANLENLTLSKLSASLEKLLVDDDYKSNYCDEEIVVEGIPVGVHRCILAARSQFFHELFNKGKDSSVKDGKPKYLMSELLPYGKVGYEAFNVFLSYLYTGKLQTSPQDVSTCVDEGCAHDACHPAINYAVELMYASATFQMKELVMLVQRRLLNFVDKALVEDVIPILVSAFHCKLDQLLSHCMERVSRSDLDDVSLEKELPYEVSTAIKSCRLKANQESDSIMPDVDPMHEKRIRRIHKALDSDDVELVKLLLSESGITLDDAHALHYATAYCDPKIIKEVLGLGLADLNRKNLRGHTVLHVAARRKEPSVLVALLAKGACASETTLDGQTAVAICRRLTRPKDYNKNTAQGQESNKDRLCIDVLEREMRRAASMSGKMSNSSHVVADDLHMRLDYLENRVAFARLFFPAEARVAMDIADADSTSAYGVVPAPKGSNGNLREVDLNETPSVQSKRLQDRVQALIKTVATGRRYFPHCSEVLDRFLDDDMPDDAFFLEKGTPEEQIIKKRRFMELKDDFQKAFYKDMAKNNRSGLTSSSSSSSSPKEGAHHKLRKK